MNPRSLPRELLQRLWKDPTARSRNKNFSRFRDDPLYQLAVRHVRSLINLQGDLAKFKDEARVEVARLPDRAGARLTLVIPSLHLRRTMILTLPEFEMLKEDLDWDKEESNSTS